ncbi:MAG: RyR domain-containing protein [Gemmatimonadaceae bacterium]
MADLIERISAAVHDRWMATKRSQGVISRTSETGEEMMVPYDQLSELAKDLDRNSVRAVLEAVVAAGYEILPKRGDGAHS